MPLGYFKAKQRPKLSWQRFWPQSHPRQNPPKHPGTHFVHRPQSGDKRKPTPQAKPSPALLFALVWCGVPQLPQALSRPGHDVSTFMCDDPLRLL